MVTASQVRDYVRKNIGTIGVGAAGITSGILLGLTAAKLSSSRKAKKRKSTRSSVRKRNRVYHKQKKPYTARKRKDTSHRRIRYTKNNQPYIILASGKARFIKKKSVSSSRKRKGGRY